MRLVVLLAALIHCVSAYDVDVKKLEGLARARVEVEFGCRSAHTHVLSTEYRENVSIII